jgi:hypothetical protein
MCFALHRVNFSSPASGKADARCMSCHKHSALVDFKLKARIRYEAAEQTELVYLQILLNKVSLEIVGIHGAGTPYAMLKAS